MVVVWFVLKVELPKRTVAFLLLPTAAGLAALLAGGESAIKC
jgi:hypothetical protein